MYIQTCKCKNMFIPCIYIPDHKHVYTRYIHGIYMFQLTYTYSEIYVHVHMWYRHVFTMFSHFHACSSLSVQVTYLTYKHRHFIKCIYSSELWTYI